MDNLKLTLFQVCSNDSFEQNSKKINELLTDQILKESDLCVFPENAFFINIDKKIKNPHISLDAPIFKELAKKAKDFKCHLHLGTVPLFREGKFYNSTIYIDDKGAVSTPYDKIHLFKAILGPLNIDEGVNYHAGKRPNILNINGWKVGLSICFDLRFTYLYEYYAQNKCDLILIPSAFFIKTGEAHWEILTRARAIETQAYVVAPGQCGTHKSSQSDSIRKSYGHSLVIDPWGQIIEDFGSKEKHQTFILDKETIKKVRELVIMERKNI